MKTIENFREAMRSANKTFCDMAWPDSDPVNTEWRDTQLKNLNRLSDGWHLDENDLDWNEGVWHTLNDFCEKNLPGSRESIRAWVSEVEKKAALLAAGVPDDLHDVLDI